MWQDLPLWPARASALAANVDALYIFLIAVSAFMTVMIALLLFVFGVRFRSARNPQAAQIEGSTPLEITWSVLPLGVFLVMFLWGAALYVLEARPPDNAMEIFVVGKQWMWKLQHPEGVREINQLHVPIGRDVRLTMISQDVIHSFFIPAFRIKQDVLPGRYTTVWFRPTRSGRYHLFCAEFCGTLHSGMIGEVVAMEPADYQNWLAGGAGEGSMASTGQKLFQELGCSTCHRSDTQGRGPSLAGVHGKPVLLDNGASVVADDNYVRESILQPGAKVVAGFQPIMPTFQGVLNEEQVLSLVAYIKSMAQPQPREPVSNRPPVPGNVPAAPSAAPSQAAPQPQR